MQLKMLLYLLQGDQQKLLDKVEFVETDPSNSDLHYAQ